MKRTIVIKRRDGVRQHYHVGRGLKVNHPFGLPKRIRLMTKRQKLRIEQYNQYMNIHDYMTDEQLAESLVRTFKEVNDKYAEELVQRHRNYRRMGLSVRARTRRSRKIDKARYDELNKMDPYPSHMVARGTNLVIVDTRGISEKFRKDINEELAETNRSISLFEEPDAPTVVHVIGRKDDELFEEVLDLTDADAREKQNRFIEEIMLR